MHDGEPLTIDQSGQEVFPTPDVTPVRDEWFRELLGSTMLLAQHDFAIRTGLLARFAEDPEFTWVDYANSHLSQDQVFRMANVMVANHAKRGINVTTIDNAKPHQKALDYDRFHRLWSGVKVVTARPVISFMAYTGHIADAFPEEADYLSGGDKAFDIDRFFQNNRNFLYRDLFRTGIKVAAASLQSREVALPAKVYTLTMDRNKNSLEQLLDNDDVWDMFDQFGGPILPHLNAGVVNRMAIGHVLTIVRRDLTSVFGSGYNFDWLFTQLTHPNSI